MAIQFKCPCGADCSADEMKVGQTIRCEACGKDVKVPEPGDAPVAEVLVEPGPSAMQGLQEIIGHGDVNEMIRQVKEARGIPAGAPAPGAGVQPSAVPVGAGAPAGAAAGQSAGVPAIGTGPAAAAEAASAEAAGQAPAAWVSAPVAEAARPASAEPEAKRGFSLPPPPRGLDRARHHLGFKKVMWLPTLLIGFGGVGLAGWCFQAEGPTQQVMDVPEGTLKIVKSADGEMWLVPQGATAKEHEDGTMWYTAEGSEEEVAAKHVLMGSDERAWAIPQGGKELHAAGGKMYYTDPSGYEVLAEPADHALKILQEEEGFLAKSEEAKVRNADRYQKFGFGFSSVGVVLILLGFWMRHDVLMVRRATEPPPEEGEAKQEGEAAEPAEGEGAASAAAQGDAPAAGATT